MIVPRIIERVRRLPYKGQILVAGGEWVDEDQIVATIDYIPGAMRRVDAARPLGISGEGLRQHLLREEGESVQAGDVLAVSSSFGERRAVLSPRSGHVGLVSRSLGYLYVREPIPVGRKDPVTIDVAKELRVAPALVGNFLEVQVRSVVVPEQVVARRRIGLRQEFVLSDVYGRVSDISEGKVTIQPLHVQTEIPAYLAGQVTRVTPGHAVTIRARGWVIQGTYGVGGERSGHLMVAADPGVDLTAADISAAWSGKVVLAGGSADLGLLQAASRVGAQAIVLASLPLETLQSYSFSHKLGITGDEDLPLTIILTEGFLEAPMAQPTWSTLARLEGRYASVNGMTHIRAGVIRPEVVVCERNWEGFAPMSASAPTLRCGARVRVIAGRHVGQSGEIVELPAEPRTIATGSSVHVAVIRAGAKLLTVPVQNLDLQVN